MKNDKILHLIAGIVASVSTVLMYYSITNDINILVGLVTGILIGIGKELYDEYDYGGFDQYDMFATWFGAIIGTGVVYFLF